MERAHKYEFEGKVRYSEIDHRATMTLPALINYFQDCSTFQSEQLGYGMDVLKKEKYLTLTTWMRRLYCLFLDRSDPKQGLKTILTAIDYIKRGISICIFPEGTRNTGAELSLLPFKDGAFKIATKTGCPIVPICMNNTAEIFENHFPKIRKTHVVIEYQKPIYPDRLDKETKRHIGDHVESIIKETIEKNAKLYF